VQFVYGKGIWGGIRGGGGVVEVWRKKGEVRRGEGDRGRQGGKRWGGTGKEGTKWAREGRGGRVIVGKAWGPERRAGEGGGECWAEWGWR